jgi:hypothetical protein
MARRRKPEDLVETRKPGKASKPEAKRAIKKPKDAVLGYMRERYGHY